jgi:hypothetical protein
VAAATKLLRMQERLEMRWTVLEVAEIVVAIVTWIALAIWG